MPPTNILPGSSDYAGHHYTCEHKIVMFHHHMNIRPAQGVQCGARLLPTASAIELLSWSKNLTNLTLSTSTFLGPL